MTKEFMKILDKILKDNPMQRERICSILATADNNYYEFADTLSTVFNNKLFDDDISWGLAIESYKKTCKELLREQLYFKKSGAYRYDKLEQVRDHVYDNEEKMKEYMYGLLLSYLFWPNQYKILEFYSKILKDKKAQICLDVGPGHGLFAYLCHKNTKATIHLVDISNESLEITKNFLEAFDVYDEKIQYFCLDFLNMISDTAKYDLITMGEVIEHVEQPEEFLRIARDLLNSEGELFLSTCINSPAVDHIFQFRSLDEVRSLIEGSYLEIITELILPMEEIASELWEERMVGINYAALLRRIEDR